MGRSSCNFELKLVWREEVLKRIWTVLEASLKYCWWYVWIGTNENVIEASQLMYEHSIVVPAVTSRLHSRYAGAYPIIIDHSTWVLYQWTPRVCNRPSRQSHPSSSHRQSAASSACGACTESSAQKPCTTSSSHSYLLSVSSITTTASSYHPPSRW